MSSKDRFKQWVTAHVLSSATHDWVDRAQLVPGGNVRSGLGLGVLGADLGPVDGGIRAQSLAKFSIFKALFYNEYRRLLHVNISNLPGCRQQ